MAILASIWPARKQALLKHLLRFLRRQAVEGLVEVRIRPGLGRPKGGNLPIVFRADDRADYQTMWECLNDDVYEKPPIETRYVLDGGANIGLFSVSALRRLGAVDIIAVEPDQANLRLLSRNATFLPASAIIGAALGEKGGDVIFERADSNTGHVRGAPAHVQPLESYVVPCRRLEEILPKEWEMNCTWVKLDIEGAEYEVIRDLLHSHLRPAVISIEVHEFTTAGGAELVSEMKDAGYQISMLDAGDDLNTCRQVTAVYHPR